MYFMKNFLSHTNIELNTLGAHTHTHLSVKDAIAAIFILLQKGEMGRAYNVANEETYISIYNMAKWFTEKIAQNQISFKVKLDAQKAKQFSEPIKVNMDTTTLKNLGWTPTDNLETMYKKTIAYLEEENSINGNVFGN
jgi:dTDP-D-glucose 4,6-dehydratase